MFVFYAVGLVYYTFLKCDILFCIRFVIFVTSDIGEVEVYEKCQQVNQN